MKKLKIPVFALLLFAVSAVGAYASSSWSDARTFSLTNGDDWTQTTTTGTWVGNEKDSDSASYTEYTVAKTMWTSPSMRLVNSNGEVRSATIACADAGYQVNGGSNTGTIGYAMYASVKPSVFQTGTDTIKLQFKVY
jgi:hypothetical protein